METIIGIVIVVVILAGIVFTAIEKNNDNSYEERDEPEVKKNLKQESKIELEETRDEEDSNSTEWLALIPGLFIAFLIMIPILKKAIHAADAIISIIITIFGLIIAGCICVGIFKLMIAFGIGVKNTAKEVKSKVKKEVKKGVKKGVDLADKTTQKVANKVAKVIIDAKQNASEPDEKEKLKNKIKDLELEILKEKVKELEDKLKEKK